MSGALRRYPARCNEVAASSPGAQRPRAGIEPAQGYAKKIKLSIGDVAASAEPAHMHTLLGSCVAVCLHDPAVRAGGMNHILLPGTRGGDESKRYGVHAMELLINRLMGLGCDRRRLVAKAFGGANLLQQAAETAVGARNITFVREFLALERIPLVAQRMGGTRALLVDFYSDTFRVTVSAVRDGETRVVAGRERLCKPSFSAVSTAGDITLF